MEIVVWTFRLADGVDEAEFLVADARVQAEFSYQQPGLVRRTVARGERGEWLMLVMWGSPEESARALVASRDDPATRAMNALIDPSSIDVKRFVTLE